MTQTKANEARSDNTEMWLIYSGYSCKHRQEDSRPVTTNTAFRVPGIRPTPYTYAMAKRSHHPKHLSISARKAAREAASARRQRHHHQEPKKGHVFGSWPIMLPPSGERYSWPTLPAALAH